MITKSFFTMTIRHRTMVGAVCTIPNHSPDNFHHNRIQEYLIIIN